MTTRFAAVLLPVALAACTPVTEQPQSRQRQMFGLIQKFDRFDDDGDGYLTRRELDTGLRESGALHLTPAKVDQVMRGYDRNGDKRISQKEAQKGADAGPGIFGGES